MKGKVVIVTGASRGIGAEAARAFAAAGASVALLGRNQAQVQDVAAGMPDALALGCDVAKWPSVEAAVRAVRDRWGRVDVMINNAGVIDPIATLAEADAAAWGQSIDINLKGVFYGMKAVIPAMRAQGAGTIITVSSGAAVTAREGWSAYCAGKAGALMLTQAAQLEEGPNGLRVLGLSPGTVATDMQQRIKASGVNEISRLDWSTHIPPEWVGRALVWACGAEADPWLGRDISLREDAVRRAVGLIA